MSKRELMAVVRELEALSVIVIVESDEALNEAIGEILEGNEDE
jgi:hypothetical protein